MDITLHNFINESEINHLQNFLYSLYKKIPEPFFLQNNILLAFQSFMENEPNVGEMPSSLRFLQRVQELLIIEEQIVLLYRPRIASSRIYSLNIKTLALEEVSIDEFLSIKERLIKAELPFNQRTMKLDFSPFFEEGPSIKDPTEIGEGIKHLNRYLSVHLSQDSDKWCYAVYRFLALHHLQGTSVMVDDKVIPNFQKLKDNLEYALDFLERSEPDISDVKTKLYSQGFLDGWGDTPERIAETMKLLQRTLEQPNEEILEEFMARVPIITSVAAISPHGWFCQSDVLGLPDTGGQVIYILDQVKALEKYLIENLKRSGLDIMPKILIVTRLIPENNGTNSNNPKEKVHDTQNSWIIRVPFRNESGDIVPQWISRFNIWPYLDRFAEDVKLQMHSEFNGEPSLIIGNYSDGNLVATLLSKSFGSIQCNIAHATEKSKYLFSDLYWDKFEEKYNFSIQFIADLLAMNSADIIIASTANEITGTESTVGQYESHQFFTMPGLMNVNKGLNLFSHRFNIISPGVDEKTYFPYKKREKRLLNQTNDLSKLLFEQEHKDVYGTLKSPDLVPIFTLARLDKIKNITGLVEAYGKSQELRKRGNLIIVAGILHKEKSSDEEEKAEIEKMYNLIDKYSLDGHIRWLGMLFPADDVGEIYRIIADKRGFFVQSALFETFGLTVLESMHSGVPVFATCFGGPLEIIEDQTSGFRINPTNVKEMTEIILSFMRKVENSPEYWDEISDNSMKRAQGCFSWSIYCERLIRLSKVYSFWRHYESNSTLRNKRMENYCDLLYNLYLKPRAEKVKN